MRIICITLSTLILSVLLPLKSGYAAHKTLPALPHEASLIRGLQVLDQGRWGVGADYIAQATGGLSSRVFYWMSYTSSRDDSDIEWIRISRFMMSHKHWPDMGSMKKNAEKVMPETLSATEVSRWFESFPPSSGRAMLRHLAALKKTGQDERFKTLLNDYWTGRLFGSSDQSKFMALFGSDISKPMYNKRLTYLLGQNYFDTATDLARAMGPGERALVAATKGLSKSESNVTALINAVPSSLSAHPALIYERIKWRRKKGMNDGVMELLNQAPKMNDSLNARAWWLERHILIRRMIEDKDYKTAYKLASHHKQQGGVGFAEAEFMSGWLALRFVDQPHKAYQHFKNLYGNVKTAISKSRGAYWAGRAAQANGQEDLAIRWYQSGAFWKTTFYGQRSYEALQRIQKTKGAEVSIKARVPLAVSVSDEVWNKWMSDDRVVVMRLLYKAGLDDRAMQFLSRMLNDDDNSVYDFMALSELVTLMGFTKGEVKVAKKAAYRGMVLIDEKGVLHGYPMLSKSDWPKRAYVGPSHIHAIIRQESEFNPKARSPVGALGFMQLMPQTAKQVSGEMGLKYNKAWLRDRPAYNVQLGSQYLNDLMKNYDRNVAMSAAAYNAGPHRVKTWVGQFGDPRARNVDLIDWIEMIPFSETRNYVQRIYEAEAVYKHNFSRN